MALKAKIEWKVYEGTTLDDSSYEVTTRNSEAELRARIFTQCEKDFPTLADATITREENDFDSRGFWTIEAETDTHTFLLTISNLN